MVPFVSETGPFCFQCFGFQLSLQIKKNQKIDFKKVLYVSVEKQNYASDVL